MELKRNDETIQFPIGAYENISNPTLAQMLALGFVEYIAPPNPPPTAEQIEAQKADLIMQIARAAKEYVEDRANAALQDEIREYVRINGPHAMVTATLAWGRTVYMESEVRKSQVQAGVADNPMTLCDFSGFGDKPYTVYQLYVAGLVQL